MDVSWKTLTMALSVGATVALTCLVLERVASAEEIALCNDPALICAARGGVPPTCAAGANPCTVVPGSPPDINCSCEDIPTDPTKCYCEASF